MCEPRVYLTGSIVIALIQIRPSQCPFLKISETAHLWTHEVKVMEVFGHGSLQFLKIYAGFGGKMAKIEILRFSNILRKWL